MKLPSFLLDSFFGCYLALTFHRVLWYRVFVDQPPPDFIWSSLLIYVAIGIVYAVLTLASGASLSQKIFASREQTKWQQALATHTAWILIVMTFVSGWVASQVNLLLFFSQEKLDAAGRLFRDLLSPQWQILDKVLLAMIETIYLAFMATVIALPFSFLLGFLSARNLMSSNAVSKTIYYSLRILTNFTRSIEPLVWAVIFTVWVGVGPFPGMLALMIHTISSLAKQYSEQIEDIDEGPMEAIEATGAKPLQIIWYAVVPQIVIPFLSFTIYRWDINVRMATVIGLVGGGGIGSMLVQYQQLSFWREVGMIVLVIAFVVWLMDYLSARIREALL